MRSHPFSKTPNHVPYILFFIWDVFIPPVPALYLKGHKVPNFHSGLNQSFPIDLPKRSVHTEAHSGGE